MNIENLYLKNLRSSNICLVNIENCDFKNPRYSNTVFSIFTYNEYRKHGCLKISGFLKSKFSIFTFTVGEYRKHGFLKVREKIRGIRDICVFDLAHDSSQFNLTESAPATKVVPTQIMIFLIHLFHWNCKFEYHRETSIYVYICKWPAGIPDIPQPRPHWLECPQVDIAKESYSVE